MFIITNDSTDLSTHKTHKIYFTEATLFKRKIIIRYYSKSDTETIL